MENKIIILGGDSRMDYLYMYLAGDGLNVCRLLGNKNTEKNNTEDKFDISHISGADIIILGMPASYDGINVSAPFADIKVSLADIADSFGGRTIFGGVLPKSFCERAELNGINCTDYSKTESLMVYNAISTAEGAILTAMQNTPFTVCGSKCLVTGYGRIGKILAQMLKGLGAEVTVSARKDSDFAYILSNGLKCADSQNIKTALTDKNIIFNTVPHNLINNEYYRLINKDALIIDLASKPGYINKELCGKYGIKNVHALALPGKTAPQSAGYAIYKTVKKVI